MSDDDHINGRTNSHIAKVIVALLTVIPIVSVIAYGAVDSVAMGVLFVLAAIVVLLWAMDAVGSGSVLYSGESIQLPLIGLIVLAVVQLLPIAGVDPAVPALDAPVARSLTSDPYGTRFFLIHLLIYLALFSASLVYVSGARRLKRTAIAIVVFGAVLAFFGILQRLSMPDAIYGLRETPQAIPFGPYVNQHHFAALMQMTSGVALGLLFGGGAGRERKLFIALAAGIMGMAIIFTGSRGGLISYLCVVTFAAIASVTGKGEKSRKHEDATDRRNRKLLVVIAAGGLVVLVLGSVLFLGGQDSLLRGVGLQNTQDDITSGRLHFWSGAWQIFLENPLVGVGLNGFGMAFSRFDTWSGLYRVEQAHNDYLQMLADGGVLGFACVGVFVFLLLKRGLSAIANQADGLSRSIVTGALAGCVGILIHSAFDFPLRTPANALVFLLIVALIVGNASPVRRSGRRGREV